MCQSLQSNRANVATGKLPPREMAEKATTGLLSARKDSIVTNVNRWIAVRPSLLVRDHLGWV